MPHSLRVRLSALRYKKIISDKDYDRLCKALDNENVLDKIKSEVLTIPQIDSDGHNNNWYREPQKIIDDVSQIIDKYKAESEE